MSDNEFLQGLRLETKEGQYGEFIKGSIDLQAVRQNPINGDRWINFLMFKSKAGKWYAVQAKKQADNTNVVGFDEEIPF